jgi:DNA-binding MarR family transcriptional regulator
MEKRMDFGILLNVAFAQFRQELELHLAMQGFEDVGPSFGYVIRCVATGPTTLTELAQQLRITAQGASKIVESMIEAKYLTRAQSKQDRRSKLITLTSRGKQLMSEAQKFHRLYEQRLGERHGKRALIVLREVLESMLPPGAHAHLRAGPT